VRHQPHSSWSQSSDREPDRSPGRHSFWQQRLQIREFQGIGSRRFAVRNICDGIFKIDQRHFQIINNLHGEFTPPTSSKAALGAVACAEQGNGILLRSRGQGLSEHHATRQDAAKLGVNSRQSPTKIKKNLPLSVAHNYHHNQKVSRCRNDPDMFEEFSLPP
jgi:hypothetical protein